MTDATKAAITAVKRASLCENMIPYLLWWASGSGAVDRFSVKEDPTAAEYAVPRTPIG